MGNKNQFVREVRANKPYEITLDIRPENTPIALKFCLKTMEFEDGNVSMVDVVRYLKGIYTNYERFKKRFIEDKMKQPVTDERIGRTENEDGTFSYNQEEIDNHMEDYEMNDYLDEMLRVYNEVEPFSYQEAFEYKNEEFQRKLFGSINIEQMIEQLPTEKIQETSIKLTQPKFDFEGNQIGESEIEIPYSLHSVDITNLGAEDTKCEIINTECPSSKKQHWIWNVKEGTNDPLEAIASTFMVHEKLIPFITAIYRQGDELILECSDEALTLGDDTSNFGQMVSLTKDQYFGLIKQQS